MMEERRDTRGLTEAEAIARYQSRNYPKPALTADIVVLTREKAGVVRVLLVERGGHPFIGCLALPGGFANENEPVETTAARELAEETGVQGLPMELIGVFSRPGRDPRGWVVSAAFAAVVDAAELPVRAGDDAAAALWCNLEKTPTGLILRQDTNIIEMKTLAFDHAEIIQKAVEMLDNRLFQGV